MPSYSPEGTFFLTLFMLVLSGVALVAFLWMHLSDSEAASARGRRALLVGFSLLIVAFTARALHCWLTLYFPPSELGSASYALQSLSDLAKVLAGSILLIGFLRHAGRVRRAVLLGGVASVLLSVAALRFSSDAALSLDSIVPLTTARGAETAVLATGVLLLGRSRGLLPPITFLLLASGGGMAAVGRAWPNLIQAAWAVDHGTTLAGLVLLALATDQQHQRTLLRFFLRLNLIFVVLASSLILTVTEVQRRQFVAFSARHADDLAEFVRGHMLYYTSRGESPDEVLAHEDVLRKVVAEFGRYPDLRRVQVSLQGRTMALEINELGEIAQAFSQGVPRRPPPVSPADFAVALLMKTPILVAGRPIGSVELDHSLRRINQQIGRQMLVIFGVLTLFVTVATAGIGMLVLGAERTIRRQYDELEGTRRRLSFSERLASIGAVADGVAHEINNPAGILLARVDYLQSVVQESPISADIAGDLDTIRRQAQRIAKTVKDLLTFSRPSPVRTEAVDLPAVLKSAMQLVRPLVAERPITLQCHCDPKLPPLRGDQNRLEQVFINLLVNSVQAISGSGDIMVVASTPPSRDRIEVVVRDTGVGIPLEHLERIFDPFFTTKEPGSGTGLGLSIAYGIIRDHGGGIDVVSTPGRGTALRVTLPSARSGSGEAIEPSEPAGAMQGPASADGSPERPDLQERRIGVTR